MIQQLMKMRCSTSVKRNKLKDAIIAELAASTNPSMAINPDLIDLRLQQFLPTLQTPTHPPYSLMIQQAILKLNEECGSKEEDISRFIEKEYKGLPWAHASFLSHHLERLCRTGELTYVDNERYMVCMDDGDFRNKEETSLGLKVSNCDEKEDRALVRGKGSEVEVFNGWSGVNGDRVLESEKRCEVERQSVEVNGRNRASDERTEGFEEQMEGRRESINDVREESQHFNEQIELSLHLEKLCRNGEIVCVNNEDDGDLQNEEEMSHRLNVSNSVEKEDQTLVQGKWSEVEAFDVCNGVNSGQAAESETWCEVERQSVEVKGQDRACDGRTEGFEEQMEGRRESINEVRERSQHFNGQIETSHHLEKLCEDDGDLWNEEDEMSHRLNISNSIEKEDRTLGQGKRSDVEAFDSCNGVNSGQAAESETRCEVERQCVEVSGQKTACEQRMEGCTIESINEVQEESQNFGRQIEESNHSEKLCRNAEIECVNNERQARHLDDGDLVNEEEMCHRFCMSNISNSDESEDQTLVQVKEREVEAINGLSGVNGDQAAESKNRCKIGTHSIEVSDKNTTSERRTEGFEKQKDGRREPLKEVQEESQNFSGQIGVSCHLEKHGEIDNADNERSMVHMDDAALGKENDEKEDRTLVQEKGTEVEAFVGSSGVKGDQADNGEACEQITEGFEEQNEGTWESLEEVQEGQNISDPIEVAEEVDIAKGKPTKVAQKRRGQKRKRQVKTREQRKVARVLINEGRKESLKEVEEESENFSSPIEVAEEIPIGKLNKVTRKPRGKKRKRQELTNKPIKVLKDDIPWPMMENEKKYVKERQQQMKGGNGVTKSVGEQDQPQRGKMVSEQGSQDPKIDVRTKTLVNPLDGDVKNLKISPPKRSARLLEKKKKEGLKHEEQRQRKLRERERRLLIVCALPAATQPRKDIDPEARTTPRIDLESREWGKILLRQLKRPRSRTHANREGNMAERFTQSEPKLNGTSKNSELEEEKQEPRMKVYVRRKVKKSQLKEPENNIVLSSNLE
ncbi:hypothetical protein Goklo_003311 [Gossypium klotzschianum]|uniref:H15 domain-containing protein n=1 Tax=Gossypium klotzschianum TaxID=34286 RepID=A0A7J8VVX0_9ROSI|nr:hypothetical protein [Gossypium klotzschianum]